MTNEEFIQLISRKYYKSLYQYVKQICPDKNLTSDIVQDTFLIAYEKADDLHAHQNIQGWLYRTARYRMLKQLEIALSYEELEEFAETLDDGKNYEEDIIDTLELYPEMAKHLDPYELRLILRHYEEGYDYTELARESHSSKASIKMRLQRIRRKLQEGLRQEYI